MRTKVCFAKLSTVELINRFGGSSYFDIRVVVAQGADSASPTPVDETRSATTKPSGKNRQGGRTRTSDEIGRTARQLWDTQQAFRTLPLKLMVGEVRAAIHGPDSRDLELVNYKSSSMEKVIADALRTRREAYINQYLNASFIEDNPIPRHSDHQRLRMWFEPFFAAERRAARRNR